MAEKVLFRIRRQEASGGPSRLEEFEVRWRCGLTVIGALMDIRRNPVNRAGARVAPVAWDANCLEEVCGACAMRINGRVRQACSALVEDLERPILLEPLAKFPVVRDLVVDRARLFEGFRQVKGWIPIEGPQDAGAAPLEAPGAAAARHALSTCIACGACDEACPQFHERSTFVGAAALNQAYLMNLHPTAGLHRDERLAAVVAPGGIQCCGNAQVCVEVCPKEIPLTTSIAALNRQATGYLFRRLLGR
jgi:succinate dehydrogenase / fumarate reductase iron-sulfur subunit